MEVDQVRVAESTFANTKTRPGTTKKRDGVGSCAALPLSRSWFSTGAISTHTNDTGSANNFALSPRLSFLFFL